MKMVRTKNQIHSAKSKGAQFEYNVHASLEPKFPDILITKERGFQKQYDLQSVIGKFTIECKCHKGFSWNKLTKLFAKLQTRTPKGYEPFLIFKANQQPVLVMCNTLAGFTIVQQFEDHFFTPFIKHKSFKIVNPL